MSASEVSTMKFNNSLNCSILSLNPLNAIVEFTPVSRKQAHRVFLNIQCARVEILTATYFFPKTVHNFQ